MDIAMMCTIAIGIMLGSAGADLIRALAKVVVRQFRDDLAAPRHGK